MSKQKANTFTRVRSIFRESAEAAPSAYFAITLFTLIGLAISTLNYLFTGGQSFSNLYSVSALLIGLVSVFYVTQATVIHGEAPSLLHMIKTKRFWLYASGLVLVALSIIISINLTYGSVINGWGSFMEMIGIEPSAYGFPPIEQIAAFVTVMITLVLMRKLSLVLPEIVAGNSLSFFASWRLMKIGSLSFWLTMAAVMSPLTAMAIGYYYVRTPYVLTQILTQILTYFLVATITIVLAAAGAVFWKEAIVKAELAKAKKRARA